MGGRLESARLGMIGALQRLAIAERNRKNAGAHAAPASAKDGSGRETPPPSPDDATGAAGEPPAGEVEPAAGEDAPAAKASAVR